MKYFQKNAQTHIFALIKTKRCFELHCKVMKLAAMPSCLGGGEFGINTE